MDNKNPASWAVAAIAWRLHHVRRATKSYLLKRRKSYVERQGYGTYLIARKDSLAALTVNESQYYTQWCAPCPLFTPWVGHPDFQKVYEGVEPHTLVSPERCYTLVSLARHSLHLDGDFAECGVYKGGTALLLCRVLHNDRLSANQGKTLYLFDSFEGLPQEKPSHDNVYRQGTFAVDSIESVKQLLSDFGNLTDFRKGWIPDTFQGLDDRRYAFAHIDVDLYQSALDCCRYFYPRLVPGGVLLFDDYGFPAARGEKDAVDEFFADKPESPISLLTGQSLVIKLPQMNGTPRVAGR
jgi:O-methyltransferase